MTDGEYSKMNPYEVLEQAKKSFLSVENSKVEEIAKPLDGMDTFEGAAALCLALMSVLSASTITRKHAAIAVSAFSSVMIGLLSNTEDDEYTQ